MGQLFSGEKKKEKNQKKEQPKQQQKKELTQGEKVRIKLQDQRDKLRKQRQQCEVNQANLEKQIQALIAEKKREQAKFLFQRKVLYDNFLTTLLTKEQVIAQQILNVDQAISDKQMADIVLETNDVIKDIQSSIDQDKVQDALLDLQENKQRQAEMNAIYKQYGVDNEEEIDDLYNKYENEANNKIFSGLNTNKDFVPLPQQQQQQYSQPPQQQKQQQQYQMSKDDQKMLADLE